MQVIERPVWRSFTEKWLKNAAEWVRRGGAALVWRKTASVPSAWLLLPLDADGAMPEMAYWALLALYRDTYTAITRGHAKGLAWSRVQHAYEHEVELWCERDSVHLAPVRKLELDCLACGACCEKNRVVLDGDDFARFTEAGRPELLKKPWVRTVKGVKLMALQPNGKCVHLQHDNRCDIYALRPDNCRWFPAGTEPCLIARREERGWIDGAAPS
jgi:hypothetical protein